MHETWLRPNRRAILFGCVPAAAVVSLGTWLALGAAVGIGWRLSGGILALIGGVALIGLLSQLWQARIGYHDGHVLFYLTGGRPLDVPVAAVEAFFLGQGPSGLPGGVCNQPETANLVARLSQRETEWAQRDVKPALGAWCGGYVTIRGTWCEPLNHEVIRRLNRRLKEVQAERNLQ
jgi:hypothetical protein